MSLIVTNLIYLMMILLAYLVPVVIESKTFQVAVWVRNLQKFLKTLLEKVT